MTEKLLSVPSISCGHCKATIEGAVGRLDGVESVSVDVPGKTVLVRYDGATVDTPAIVDAIEETGYRVERGVPVIAHGPCCG